MLQIIITGENVVFANNSHVHYNYMLSKVCTHLNALFVVLLSGCGEWLAFPSASVGSAGDSDTHLHPLLPGGVISAIIPSPSTPCWRLFVE